MRRDVLNVIRAEFERLYEERVGKQKALSDLTGDEGVKPVNQSQVSDFISGRRGRKSDPKLSTFIRLVSAMGVKLSEFFARVEANPLSSIVPNDKVEPPSGEGQEAHSPDTVNALDPRDLIDARGATPISSDRADREIRRLQDELQTSQDELKDSRSVNQSLRRIITATVAAQSQSAGDRSLTGGDTGASSDVPERSTGTHPHTPERRKGDRRGNQGHQQRPRLEKKS